MHKTFKTSLTNSVAISLLLSSIWFSGCATSLATKDYSNVSYYDIGILETFRNLTTINEFVPEKIKMHVYSDGVFAFFVDRIHFSYPLEVRLTKEQQEQLKIALNKSLKIGEIVEKEKLNISKELYSFKDNPIAMYPSLALSFISGGNGEIWGAHLTLGLTEKFVLLEDQINHLISQLDNVEISIGLAIESQKKMGLIK